jgi:hypothetical protein
MNKTLSFIVIISFLLISFILLFYRKNDYKPSHSSNISSLPLEDSSDNEKFMNQYVYQTLPMDYSHLLNQVNGDWGYNNNKNYRKMCSSYSFLESPFPYEGSERNINN